MKVVLVHDWLTGLRGGEKCLETLCRMFPDADLYTLLHARGSTSPTIERMRISTSFLQRVPGITRGYRYLLPLMPTAIESMHVPADTDLVVSTSHAVAKGIKSPPGVPHVCYCFTPMRYAWHLRDDYFSATGTRRTRSPLALVRDRLLDRIRRWDQDSSDRVSHYVAISNTIADRIAECYGRNSTVVYPPVDTEFYTPGMQTQLGFAMPRQDYYLCVSALVPYKRIDLAIEACQKLGRKLVIIGRGPETARLKRLAGDQVEFLGWRSDEEIREHLRHCRALLFPGNEDFGIAPVEAQACGTPVVAYGRGGVTETVLSANEKRVGSGVFFAEQNAESLAEAMVWLEQHPAQCSAHLARQQAVKFSAARFERQLHDTILSVLPVKTRLAA